MHQKSGHGQGGGGSGEGQEAVAPPSGDLDAGLQVRDDAQQGGVGQAGQGAGAAHGAVQGLGHGAAAGSESHGKHEADQHKQHPLGLERHLGQHGRVHEGQLLACALLFQLLGFPGGGELLGRFLVLGLGVDTVAFQNPVLLLHAGRVLQPARDLVPANAQVREHGLLGADIHIRGLELALEGDIGGVVRDQGRGCHSAHRTGRGSGFLQGLHAQPGGLHVGMPVAEPGQQPFEPGPFGLELLAQVHAGAAALEG